ncbi:hypothetical protein ACOMHN_036634 [Nucella lapillus]
MVPEAFSTEQCPAPRAPYRARASAGARAWPTLAARLWFVVAIRLPPLWDRLSPLLERLSPLRRKFHGCLPSRSRHRWLMALAAASLFMMILVTYSRSLSPGSLSWLGSLVPWNGSSGTRECSLWCPKVRAHDALWRPRAVPLEQACYVTASLPLPCAPNASTRSEILGMVCV